MTGDTVGPLLVWDLKRHLTKVVGMISPFSVVIFIPLRVRISAPDSLSELIWYFLVGWRIMLSEWEEAGGFYGSVLPIVQSRSTRARPCFSGTLSFWS